MRQREFLLQKRTWDQFSRGVIMKVWWKVEFFCYSSYSVYVVNSKLSPFVFTSENSTRLDPFRSKHIEDYNCAFLGYYEGSSVNFLQMFRDNLSVPSSGSRILTVLGFTIHGVELPIKGVWPVWINGWRENWVKG